ncbi:hypothetical protein GCM10007859_17470 [Brevundimonas denitrificans]|uniref:Uncharacterized protein n=1 Tax=Brevundimonas denitrificans TaxID=1443434 RepID=A0ABQ6BNG9_9CAUL|nr:hypothetical protein GCM10007859_17470 [Brevundimonas denitrificans]
MVGQPVQGGVGQNQVGGRFGAPGRDIALTPVDIGAERPRLRQHLGAGIQSMHRRRGMPPLQHGRVLARAAAQVPDLARIEVAGQAQQQIEGGAIALGLEAAVLSGVPGGGRVGHAGKRLCGGRRWYRLSGLN